MTDYGHLSRGQRKSLNIAAETRGTLRRTASHYEHLAKNTYECERRSTFEHLATVYRAAAEELAEAIATHKDLVKRYDRAAKQEVTDGNV